MLEDFSPTDFSGQPDAPPARQNLNADKPARTLLKWPWQPMKARHSVPDFPERRCAKSQKYVCTLAEPLLVAANLATQQIRRWGTSSARRQGTYIWNAVPAKPVKVARFHRRSRHLE